MFRTLTERHSGTDAQRRAARGCGPPDKNSAAGGIPFAPAARSAFEPPRPAASGSAATGPAADDVVWH